MYLHVFVCVQEEENRLREELRQEWERKQEKIKGKSSENFNYHVYLFMNEVGIYKILQLFVLLP